MKGVSKILYGIRLRVHKNKNIKAKIKINTK